MANKANKEGCTGCTTDSHCCGCWIFERRRGLPLTLSLESRQTWAAVGNATSCPAIIPYGNNPTGVDPTRIILSSDLKMTYQNPIPSSFLTNLTNQQYESTKPTLTTDVFGNCTFHNEYLQNPNFYVPEDGWHVSEEVKLYQVPGDSVWTGNLYNATGRYFVARQFKWVIPPGTCSQDLLVKQFAACVTGFVFTSDKSTWPEGGNTAGGKSVTFNRIRNGTWVSGTKTESIIPASYPSAPNNHWERIRTATGGHIRGVKFLGLNLLTNAQCCPFFSEVQGPSLSENGCSIRGHSVSPTNIGLYASPFRGLSQTVNLGGRGDLPNVDNTPPADIQALTSNHVVSEIFYLHFTLSK